MGYFRNMLTMLLVLPLLAACIEAEQPLERQASVVPADLIEDKIEEVVFRPRIPGLGGKFHWKAYYGNITDTFQVGELIVLNEDVSYKNGEKTATTVVVSTFEIANDAYAPAADRTLDDMEIVRVASKGDVIHWGAVLRSVFVKDNIYGERWEIERSR